MWYGNGQIAQQATYKNDEFNGITTVWYENGNIKKVRLVKNDDFNGAYKTYYNNGYLKKYEIYKNDKVIKEINFKQTDKKKDDFSKIVVKK